MEKCWYIILEGATLGPFEKEELRLKPGFNPDTLVWKEGFEGWVAAREVEELGELFEDKGPPPETSPSAQHDLENEEGADEALVIADREPPFLFIWFVVAALIFVYLVYQIYFQ